MPKKRSKPSGRVRRVIERGVILLMAAVALRAWCIEGVPIPCRVHGSSMAETLLGDHCDVVCDDCGYRFPVDATRPQAGGRAVCPNCGFAGTVLDDQLQLPGDRIVIDRSAFLFRLPRRWEIAAFRRPRVGPMLAVKRIVGLPGETVEIRHGDVYINGKIQGKSLAEQRAMRILVRDESFAPTIAPCPPPQWSGNPQTQWNRAGGRWAHPAGAKGDPIDWLGYEHAQRRPDSPGQTEAKPITDQTGYNPQWPRREEDVHSTADIMLALRIVETFGHGTLDLRATDGKVEFYVRLEPASRRFAVLEDGRAMPGGTGRWPDGRAMQIVELSLFDQQFLLAVNGRTLVAHPYHRRDTAPTPPARSLAIGTQGLGLVLGEVQVFRDIYYTGPLAVPQAAAASARVQLGPGEFFVLGDNSPLSEDSRTWTDAPGVAAGQLLGKPVLILFPARETALGGWHFQCPDPGRIRYIR